MTPVNLSELMRVNLYDAALADAVKKRDVEKMAARFAAGACATSAANPLHYDAESILDILEATTGLKPAVKDTVQAVLGAMCHKRAGKHQHLYSVWMARQAAVAAMHEATV